MIDTSSENEWQRVVQQVTANGNEWYSKWQREVQRMATRDNEWQWGDKSSENEWQRVTMNDNEW